MLIATVVTHHATSWMVLAFLIAWAAVSRKGERKLLARAAVVMGVAVAIWTAILGTRIVGYLTPIVSTALQSAHAFLAGTSQHHVFGASGGTPPPADWERAFLVVYTLATTFAALACAWIMLSRAFRNQDRMLGLLGALNLAFPLTAASHFDPSVGELGDRAASFLFLPLALSCSLIIQRHPRVTRRPAGRAHPFRPAMLIALIGGTTIVYLGGTLLGSSPDYSRLPGPYLPSADFRTQDPETLAATGWAGRHLPTGATVAADRVPAVILGSEALWPVTNPQQGFAPAQLYFSTAWGPQQTAIVKGLHIDYLYVDTRLADSLPYLGYYFSEGETTKPTRITVADVAKFAHVPGLKAVYHHGPVTIYDTSGLGVVRKQAGFTGDHKMGLGPLDAILGAVVGPSHPANQKAIGMGEIDRPGHRYSRDHAGCHSHHHFRGWRTPRVSPDARPRFHLRGGCDISRDRCGSAPNGRPAACPAPALPAQTGSACPSWSRCRRGWAGDCDPGRVDHRCCRRQCDPPDPHLMAPPSLLDVPHLNGWAAQWDQLVDSSPLPSPFLRSWWLTGVGGAGRHFLLVVDGAHLLGGLALERRHPMLSVRMMGDGPLCPDHLDLLAAPGHEEAVVSLLRDWLCRPGERLFDLKSIRAGSRLIEALPGRVRREPMVVWPPSRPCPTAQRRTGPPCPRSSARTSVSPPSASRPKA